METINRTAERRHIMVGVVIMVAMVCVTSILLAGLIGAMKRDHDKVIKDVAKEIADQFTGITIKMMEDYDINFTMQPKKE